MTPQPWRRNALGPFRFPLVIFFARDVCWFAGSLILVRWFAGFIMGGTSGGASTPPSSAASSFARSVFRCMSDIATLMTARSLCLRIVPTTAIT
jgi:hypothetical protein